MAKTKADWLKEAKELGLKLTDKNKIADIRAAIEAKLPAKHDKVHAEKPLDEKMVVAKAGKRSKKALDEAAELANKTARKLEQQSSEASGDTKTTKSGPVPITRPRIERRSKKYREASKRIDRTKGYALDNALSLVIESSITAFDATVELHVRLNVDPKQSDQNIRDTVILPSGSGKTVRIAVFAPIEEHATAKKAGADLIGEKDFLDLLAKNQIDFDVLIATPGVMPQLGRFAKLLGPKGLMPNPKSGTVTTDIATAVSAAKAGRVEFRVDKQGIIHVAIGKVSFGVDKLQLNAQSVLDAIKAAKPTSVKSSYILSIFVASTMGPSVRISM